MVDMSAEQFCWLQQMVNFGWSNPRNVFVNSSFFGSQIPIEMGVGSGNQPLLASAIQLGNEQVQFLSICRWLSFFRMVFLQVSSHGRVWVPEDTKYPLVN